MQAWETALWLIRLNMPPTFQFGHSLHYTVWQKYLNYNNTENHGYKLWSSFQWLFCLLRFCVCWALIICKNTWHVLYPMSCCIFCQSNPIWNSPCATFPALVVGYTFLFSSDWFIALFAALPYSDQIRYQPIRIYCPVFLRFHQVTDLKWTVWKERTNSAHYCRHLLTITAGK